MSANWRLPNDPWRRGPRSPEALEQSIKLSSHLCYIIRMSSIWEISEQTVRAPKAEEDGSEVI
jgi:hypothetical protein